MGRAVSLLPVWMRGSGSWSRFPAGSGFGAVEVAVEVDCSVAGAVERCIVGCAEEVVRGEKACKMG